LDNTSFLFERLIVVCLNASFVFLFQHDINNQTASQEVTRMKTQVAKMKSHNKKKPPTGDDSSEERANFHHKLLPCSQEKLGAWPGEESC
jgi:hypothetical protein